MAYSGPPLYFRQNKELSRKSALLNHLESVFQQTLGTKARILAPTLPAPNPDTKLPSAL
jgi:hypothetical protein